MMIPLLWITAVYVLAAAAVHLFHAWQKRKSSPWVHYTLVTSNHEGQIEWYIRAFGWYSFISGKKLRLTVMDAASTDQTVEIVHRMHGTAGMELSVVPMQSSVENGDIAGTLVLADGMISEMIDLRKPHEAERIPYV